MAKRSEIEEYLDNLMNVKDFADYTPNGLQVEGRESIETLVASPSISHRLIDFSIENGADAILVHHGFFWKNETKTITGEFQKKIKKLLDHEISLFAYHLPLDFLEKFGNNEPVLRHLGATAIKPFMNIGYTGVLKKPLGCDDFFDKLDDYYGTSGTHIGKNGPVKKIAMVSGGGTSYFSAAVEMGIDAFVSGEGTEWVYGICRDSNVAYSAMGHYRSECTGPRLLGDHLATKFRIKSLFFEEENPF